MTSNLLWLASLLGSTTNLFFNPDEPTVPPVLTVKAARAAGPGATVTLRAVVTNGAELGNIRYVQDTDAGLALYAQAAKVPGFGELRVGDSIQVTGVLKNYNGLLEMDPVQSVHTLSRGTRLRTLRVPAEQATAAMTEANEGRLLEFTGVTKLGQFNGGNATTLAANSNYLINGLPGALVRVSSSSTGPDGLVDHSLPAGETFDVRGILSQYAPSGNGGYQLMPRVATDIVRGGGLPRLTEEPVPVNVTSNGFTIVFSTLNPGDTRVRYGLSTKELKEVRVDAALTTRHSLTLENLIPGTTYYVEVSSRNAAGTETAPAVPFITASGGKKLRIGTKN
jgi:hypothetical protein